MQQAVVSQWSTNCPSLDRQWMMSYSTLMQQLLFLHFYSAWHILLSIIDLFNTLLLTTYILHVSILYIMMYLNSEFSYFLCRQLFSSSFMRLSFRAWAQVGHPSIHTSTHVCIFTVAHCRLTWHTISRYTGVTFHCNAKCTSGEAGWGVVKLV